MAASLRSIDRLDFPGVSVQSRLAQSCPTPPANRFILEWTGRFLPVLERKLRIEAHYFRGLRARVVVSADARVSNSQVPMDSDIIGITRCVPLQKGKCFGVFPHKVVAFANFNCIDVGISRIEL